MPRIRTWRALEPFGHPLREVRREPILALHRTTDRDLAAYGRDSARRRGGLLASAGSAVAAGRFSDHSGHDAAARREPGDDGIVRDAAAGAAIRAHSRPARADFKHR